MKFYIIFTPTDEDTGVSFKAITDSKAVKDKWLAYDRTLDFEVLELNAELPPEQVGWEFTCYKDTISERVLTNTIRPLFSDAIKPDAPTITSSTSVMYVSFYIKILDKKEASRKVLNAIKEYLIGIDISI